MFPRVLTGQPAEVVVGDAAAQLDGGLQHGSGTGAPRRPLAPLWAAWGAAPGDRSAAREQLGRRSAQGHGKGLEGEGVCPAEPALAALFAAGMWLRCGFGGPQPWLAR